MSDIRDWGAFIRGRWNWTRYGYEDGFPRGCQFTDIDAAVEFDGGSLVIEAKSHPNDDEDFPSLSNGQLGYLKDEVRRGKTALVLYGCGACNNPLGVYDVGAQRLHDWRNSPKSERRAALKRLIDACMGVEREEG